MSHSNYSAQTKSSVSEKSHSSTINWSSTNPKQIFDLIDSLLTIKDCMSYQFIPLDLTDRHLVLGMVNPNNKNAINHAQSCCLDLVDSISTKPIDLKTHQLILSAYSRRSGSRNSVSSRASSMLQERPTLILDSPDTIETEQEQVAIPTTTQSVSQVLPVKDIPEQKSVQIPVNLELQPKYMSAPPRFLSSLPPQLLWQELLGRVLVAGNGRIQFDRLLHNGRIGWSQNGNVKLSIDPVAVRTFQGVLEELLG